jgi:predicted peptidase
MMTRREAVRLLGSASAGASISVVRRSIGYPIAAPAVAAVAAVAGAAAAAQVPTLAPGIPTSPERMALIEGFRQRSEGLETKFESRTHKSDWTMPYRLFRPEAAGKLPLVMYLHGSGGLGDDNEKQLGLGNIFGSRLWLLPENQQRFPCYIVVPQTDRGWVRYEPTPDSNGVAVAIAGLGDGVRLALQIVDNLRRELPIDGQRIYVTGQSMGGVGVWNALRFRPKFFAAAAICCGSAQSSEDGTGSIDTSVWNFHGDADQTVPVSLSRARIAARRKAGGHPIYTEYPGVDHNVWQWAYTEPALLQWVFARRLGQP